MWVTLPRGPLLLFLAAMIIAWAIAAGKSDGAQPNDEQAYDRLYS